MPDADDDLPNMDEVGRIMRQAVSKGRGYAAYWEWAPDRSLAEVGVAKVLSEYLTHSEGTTWKSVSPVADDPPDTLLLSTSNHRVGVEVTEIVDDATVARHRHRKKEGAAQPYDWAEWTLEELTASIVQAIERKDKKLAGRRDGYDELIVALVTDEPMITFDLARRAVVECSPKVQTIDRAFLMLSYDPAADKEVFPQGIPTIEVSLDRVA
jgi:hypothetical protein